MCGGGGCLSCFPFVWKHFLGLSSEGSIKVPTVPLIEGWMTFLGVGFLHHGLIFMAIKSSPWNYMIKQNLDWPVSLETPSWFLSRTKMASFPYWEYHMLRLLLRYVLGGTDSNFCCCCCQMSKDVSLYRRRA